MSAKKRKAVGADSSGASQPVAPGAKQSRASRQALEADNSGASQSAGAGNGADPDSERLAADPDSDPDFGTFDITLDGLKSLGNALAAEAQPAAVPHSQYFEG